MRIVHLITQLSGGGAERQLSMLAPEMALKGHEVHVAYLTEGPDPVCMPGVILHQIRVSGNYDFCLPMGVFRVLRSIKPDIVQTWIFMMDILKGSLSFLGKSLWFIREPNCAGAYTNGGFKIYARRTLAHFSEAIICNSPEGRLYWSDVGIAHERLFVIRNSIPHGPITNVKPTDKMFTGRNTLIYAGRLIPRKNVHLLIEAVAELKGWKDIFLLIAGDGPERPRLAELIQDLQVQSQVHLLGHLHPHDLWSRIKTVDAFISPSAYEGMPNSVCEAAACGVPLILSPIPSHRGLFDEKTAFYIPDLSVTKITETICNVLENRHEAFEKASRAQESVRHRSPAVVATDYLSLYYRFMNLRGHIE